MEKSRKKIKRLQGSLKSILQMLFYSVGKMFLLKKKIRYIMETQKVSNCNSVRNVGQKPHLRQGIAPSLGDNRRGKKKVGDFGYLLRAAECENLLGVSCMEGRAVSGRFPPC